MPLDSVTLISPASATRPLADIDASPEATWPLLMPIETEAPLPQAGLFEAICTLHWPS